MKKTRKFLQKLLDWFDSATKSDSNVTNGLGQSEHETTIRLLIKCITACVICIIFVAPVFLVLLLAIYLVLMLVFFSDSSWEGISKFLALDNLGTIGKYSLAVLLPLVCSFKFVFRWLGKPDHTAPPVPTESPPRRSLQQVFADFCSDILSLGPDVTERYGNNHVVFSRGKRLLCRVLLSEADRTIFVFLNEPLKNTHNLKPSTNSPRIAGRLPDIAAKTQGELNRAWSHISESYREC